MNKEDLIPYIMTIGLILTMAGAFSIGVTVNKKLSKTKKTLISFILSFFAFAISFLAIGFAMMAIIYNTVPNSGFGR